MAFEPLHVVIEDDDGSARTDPETGNVEVDTPDGGVVIQFNSGQQDQDSNSDWFRNLADEIDKMELGRLAQELYDAIDADDRSRRGHLDIVARGISTLGLKLEEPKSTVGDSTSSSEGMSSVTNPLLLEAVLKGWANARSELLPAEGPVKIAVEGDETAQEDELAEALERDMNFYLTKTATEYVPETSHMLLWEVYFKGAGFKKVYRCPMRRRPVSECVDTKNLIVSDTAKDLKSCARITLQLEMRNSVMKRMMKIGAYRDIDLPQPIQTNNVVDQKIAGIQGTQPTRDRPEDQPYNLYESQCELDLDQYAPKDFKGKGIPLPYFVTMDKDSLEILSLRRDWNEDDEDAERRQLYVKFPYVPGPGFYGTGLLGMLGNLSNAMTAVDRESLDAGMFASFPGFMISSHAARQNTSNYRVAPGEGMKVDHPPTMSIKDAIMPLPYKDVTPGLMSLREAILAQAKSLSGATEITAGEGVKDIPVGTMLAQIEQSTKIMQASHKDLHNAHADEIELFIELFREHPEDFFRGVKKRQKFDKRNKALLMAQGVAAQDIPNAPVVNWDTQKFFQALDDYQLIPRSDPNTPSHLHRVAKAVAYSQIVLNPALGPYFDKKKIAQMVCRALKDNPDGLVVDPPPQQGMDPAGMAKLMDVQVKDKQANAKIAEGQQKMEIQKDKSASDQRVADTRLETERVIHQADIARADREHAQKMQSDASDMMMQRQAHDQEMALERQSHVQDTQLEHAKHGLAVEAHHREQGRADAESHHGMALASQGQSHEQSLAEAGQVVDAHTKLNPPDGGKE